MGAAEKLIFTHFGLISAFAAVLVWLGAYAMLRRRDQAGWRALLIASAGVCLAMAATFIVVGAAPMGMDALEPIVIAELLAVLVISMPQVYLMLVLLAVVWARHGLAGWTSYRIESVAALVIFVAGTMWTQGIFNSAQ